jgi:hypothetical protein
MVALAAVGLPATTVAPANAQVVVGVSIRIAPPALPVYVQPPCPAAGYMWTPGYWAYGPDGYYWVPGTWVMAPAVGLLWTPGYWGWGVGGVYAWHAGYWGPHIGFYGGVNYGFGYGGVGFVGGAWRGGVFAYNRSVSNVNVTVIHNTYNETVVNNTTVVNHTSFNGGPNGIHAEANAQERAAMAEHHTEATHDQMEHEHSASTNRAQLYSANHGRPSVAASPKPGQFSGHGVVADGRAAAANRPPSASANRPASTNTNRPGGAQAGANRGQVRNDRPQSSASSSSHTNTNSNNSNRPPSSNNSHNTNSGHGQPAKTNDAHKGNKPPKGESGGKEH